MITKIKRIIGRILPNSILNSYHLLYELYLIWKVSLLQRKALKVLKRKEVIRCAFFATFDSTWKYDTVYKLMKRHQRFDPVILICPLVNWGYENMIERMKACASFFDKKKYSYMMAFDEASNTFVDVRKEIDPDIIFYTNPYRGLIDDRYYVRNFLDKLTVYVPYFFSTNKAYEMSYNEEMHNLVWRKYCETPIHKEYSIKYSLNRGRNTICTGYPGIEDFLHQSKDRKKEDPRKTIIWAPHHTLAPAYGVIFYSCFMKYYQFMVEMAQKYKEEIYLVFKPHPLLRNKLNVIWGKEKTDKYYEWWENGDNTSLNDGDYKELFLESDAMIHDSASFIAEYLYLNKPVMRTMNNEINVEEMHNSLGVKCIQNHYLAYNEDDIEIFINNVIGGLDPLKIQRTKFVNEELMPNGSPSYNIINDIIYSIDNQVLYH